MSTLEPKKTRAFTNTDTKIEFSKNVLPLTVFLYYKHSVNRMSVDSKRRYVYQLGGT